MGLVKALGETENLEACRIGRGHGGGSDHHERAAEDDGKHGETRKHVDYDGEVLTKLFEELEDSANV